MVRNFLHSNNSKTTFIRTLSKAFIQYFHLKKLLYLILVNSEKAIAVTDKSSHAKYSLSMLTGRDAGSQIK